MSATAPPSPSVLDTMTRIILSQTEMTEQEVKTSLERTNYDLKRVIREYMRGSSDQATQSPSTSAAHSSNVSKNQMRFSEIRNFMDKSAEQYYRRQEMAKIYNQVLERKKEEAAKAALASEAKAVEPQTTVLPIIDETNESPNDHTSSKL